jgi:hypothetical protein
MAANHAPALTYADLEMSRVDAHLKSGRELLVVLPSHHAKVLVSLIENTRQLQRGASFSARIGPMWRGLYATFRALLFHRRLLELARVFVDFAQTASWQTVEGGQVLFRFTP